MQLRLRLHARGLTAGVHCIGANCALVVLGTRQVGSVVHLRELSHEATKMLERDDLVAFTQKAEVYG